MKKQLWKVLAIIICISLMAVSFAGCGGGEEEIIEEPANNGGTAIVPGQSETETLAVDISSTQWLVDGIYYSFYDDLSVLAESDQDTAWGTYEWDGSAGYIYFDDYTVYFAVYSDNSIYMQGEDGYDYLMEYVGEIGSNNGVANAEITDEYELYYNDDGTYTFIDKIRNVSYICPQWMTVITGGIGYTTDGVVVGDNAGGYVIMDNVTDEWTAYPGYSDEYLFDYVDSFMGEFFTELYGDANDLTYEEIDTGIDTHLAAMELNVWNDSWDIQILVILQSCDDGSVLAVSYFAPYDSDAQLQTIWDEVIVIGGPF